MLELQVISRLMELALKEAVGMEGKHSSALETMGNNRPCCPPRASWDRHKTFCLGLSLSLSLPPCLGLPGTPELKLGPQSKDLGPS